MKIFYSLIFALISFSPLHATFDPTKLSFSDELLEEEHPRTAFFKNLHQTTLQKKAAQQKAKEDDVFKRSLNGLTKDSSSSLDFIHSVMSVIVMAEDDDGTLFPTSKLEKIFTYCRSELEKELQDFVQAIKDNPQYLAPNDADYAKNFTFLVSLSWPFTHLESLAFKKGLAINKDHVLSGFFLAHYLWNNQHTTHPKYEEKRTRLAKNLTGLYELAEQTWDDLSTDDKIAVFSSLQSVLKALATSPLLGAEKSLAKHITQLQSRLSMKVTDSYAGVDSY